jgi:predicted Zn-dependent peptidase
VYNLNNSKRIPLKFGISLNVVEELRFKRNRMSINLLLPLSREEASTNALLAFVLRRGCSEYPDMLSLNKKLAELFGARLSSDVSKRGEVQILTITLESLADKYALDNVQISKEAVKLLIHVLLKPAFENGSFKQSDIETERRNLIDLIDSQINDKRIYARNRCTEEMCRDEAFGISEYGTREQATAVNCEMLLKAWQRAVDTAQIEIFMIGNSDSEAISKTIVDEFSIIKRGQMMDFPTWVKPQVGEIKKVEERLPVSQAKLVLGFRTKIASPNEDTEVLQLANTVFGGSPHAKLFVNVREKLSLCYYCMSRIEKYKGLLFVECGVEEQNKDKAYDEILKQFEEIKNGNIDENELEAAKKTLSNSYTTIRDSLSGMESWYLGQVLSKSTKDPIQVADNLAKITSTDIVNVAKEISLDTVYFLAGNGEGAE